MTIEELRALCGDRKWRFSSYYKHSFTYVLDNITLSAGGDIYRADMKAEMTIEQIERESCIQYVFRGGECIYSGDCW